MEEFANAVGWCGEGRYGASAEILRSDVREGHYIGHHAGRRGADAISAILVRVAECLKSAPERSGGPRRVHRLAQVAGPSFLSAATRQR